MLLAEGLRNAQISERLFLSSKTVEHHVAAILRKLGASGRHEAGAEARRLGLSAEARDAGSQRELEALGSS